MDILQELSQNENLESVPQPQLQWLAEQGRLIHIEEGEYQFKKGDPIDNLYIVMEGMLRLYAVQNGEQRSLEDQGKGYVGGLLPYSRLKNAAGNAMAVEPTTLLLLHREKFREMIEHQDELVEVLVHLMLNRVRNFTKSQQQNEKMISLGKLSAGLAHELNNPASAVVRSATTLKQHLSTVPEKFKEVISLRMAPGQVDQVSTILFEKLTAGAPSQLTLMQKSNQEEDLSDWLEEHEVSNGYELAENLVEYRFTVQDLERIKECLSGQSLEPVLNWVDNVLTTERLVTEITEASQRIGDLVKSVKDYSHMDGGADKKKISLREGLQSTLRILQHKLKSKNISVQLNLPDHLPDICVRPGDMNQVWTNLIDNAIDASPDGGEITIEAVHDREFVITKIIDRGSGIPDDIKGQVFDPFFTTKDIGKGTGLGLEIVQNIVELQHKGQVKVQSEPGLTEFSVCLPIE
ncbi:ATP-binding protein [Telluribacter sp.]|jgi:signal transduction histidine kinase|uniref:ATP-binding protein n=1 Tax=Telluribacter sp. TaxID=1978767 RepID=UPI002E156A95|nr:ATP-binding protein [Telluribacter sp.]